MLKLKVACPLGFPYERSHSKASTLRVIYGLGSLLNIFNI